MLSRGALPITIGYVGAAGFSAPATDFTGYRTVTMTPEPGVGVNVRFALGSR